MKKMIACILCILLLGSLLSVTVLGAQGEPSMLSQTEREILSLINDARAAQGLVPLSASVTLQRASDLRAQELFSTFSHTRPDGRSCFTALDEAGVPYQKAAENIAIGYTDAASVVNGWLGSEGHYKNIMNASFLHLGVSRALQNGRAADANLFVGGCAAHTVTLSQTAVTLAQGQRIADLGLVATVSCAAHGESYLPVTDALLSDFDASRGGVQVVTLAVGEASASLTVTVGGAGQEEQVVFSDVAANAWYAAGVSEAASRGWLQGVGDGRFAPDRTLDRGMAVTVLGRMAQVKESNYPDVLFSDIPTGAYYAPYAAWAKSAGIADGVGGGRFDPTAPLTREQFCVMLYRREQARGAVAAGVDLSHLPFTDAASVSAWAREAVAYASARGWVTGMADGSFAPQAPLTRAQAAVLLCRVEH